MILGLSQDLGALKNMVLDLVKQSRAQNNPQVPEELFEHYMNLIQNQVANELAEEVIKNIQVTLRPDQKKNPEIIREKLAEQLERMMPVAGPIVRTKASGPHVVALIGPTGVGKTTTVAKLAAYLSLRATKHVCLVTTDTFRIAAVLPRNMRSPTGRPGNLSIFFTRSPLTQMRVPSCLLTASSRAATLMVSP